METLTKGYLVVWSQIVAVDKNSAGNERWGMVDILENAQHMQTYKSENCPHMKTHKWTHMPKDAKQSLEEIFNNFYYKILYSYPFIGDYYINTML